MEYDGELIRDFMDGHNASLVFWTTYAAFFVNLDGWVVPQGLVGPSGVEITKFKTLYITGKGLFFQTGSSKF